MSAPFYQVGAYVGEVTAQALGKAGTGTPQFVLRFRVLGKPDPKDPSSFIEVQQYERTIYRAITPNTIDYFLEDLEKLGYSGNSFGPLDPGHADHHSFASMQIDVWCKHEKNASGDMQEKWQLSRGQSGLKVDPLDSKGVRELDSMFGKALKSKLPTKSAPQPVAVGANDLGITDDDVPF